MKEKSLWERKLVKFCPSKEEFNKYNYEESPFRIGEVFLCLGEIKNMPEHYIFIDKNGRIFWGYHNDFFKILTEDET